MVMYFCIIAKSNRKGKNPGKMILMRCASVYYNILEYANLTSWDRDFLSWRTSKPTYNCKVQVAIFLSPYFKVFIWCTSKLRSPYFEKEQTYFSKDMANCIALSGMSAVLRKIVANFLSLTSDKMISCRKLRHILESYSHVLLCSLIYYSGSCFNLRV